MFDPYIMFVQGLPFIIDLFCVNLLIKERTKIDDTYLFDICYIPRRRLSLMKISLSVHKFALYFVKTNKKKTKELPCISI